MHVAQSKLNTLHFPEKEAEDGCHLALARVNRSEVLRSFTPSSDGGSFSSRAVLVEMLVWDGKSM